MKLVKKLAVMTANSCEAVKLLIIFYFLSAADI
jgi:hypothetical protein